MHATALLNAERFFDVYAPRIGPGRVVDIGAQDVNGSLRSVCPPTLRYTGVDFVAGKGVDVVLDDPYRLPFPDATFDVALSSSCFEHSEFFWLLFLEIMRVLKPAGLFYLNVPANGPYHRYPVDCWRFYPDSAEALVRWGRRNGVGSALLESFTTDQYRYVWNDFVAVIVRDADCAGRYPDRIVRGIAGYSNAHVHPADGAGEPLQMQQFPQDQRYLGWRWHKKLSLWRDRWRGCR